MEETCNIKPSFSTNLGEGIFKIIWSIKSLKSSFFSRVGSTEHHPFIAELKNTLKSNCFSEAPSL